MKVCELMVGDLVSHDGKVIRVDAVHKRKIGYHKTNDKLTWLFDGQFQPIQLTPEILEKNGFEGIKEGRFPSLRNYYNDIIFQLEGIKEEGNYKILYIFKNIPILYVHELQHALRLCRVDKEIVL